MIYIYPILSLHKLNVSTQSEQAWKCKLAGQRWSTELVKSAAPGTHGFDTHYHAWCVTVTHWNVARTVQHIKPYSFVLSSWFHQKQLLVRMSQRSYVRFRRTFIKKQYRKCKYIKDIYVSLFPKILKSYENNYETLRG